MRSRVEWAMVIGIAICLASCKRNTPPANASVPSAPRAEQQRAFLDLIPGWRLSVITPLVEDNPGEPLRYGRLALEDAGQAGLSLTVKAARVTFETSTYEVTGRGLRLQSPQPVLAVFGKPMPGRTVLRLLFLTRASQRDYNMAVLAARNLPEIELLTKKVQELGDKACREERRRWCVWVPPGVAVRPEMPAPGGGWKPVL